MTSTETAKTLQSTSGNPEFVRASYGSAFWEDGGHPAFARWELADGAYLTFTAADEPDDEDHRPPTVELHAFETEDGVNVHETYFERAVTREQVAEFARHLLVIVGSDADTLASRLAETVATLQQHIEQRAEEIAAPKIAEARQEAQKVINDLTSRYATERQRFDDLIAELRRQLDVQLKQVDKHRRALLEITEYAEQHANESEHVRAIENTARMVVGYQSRSSRQGD